jgi:hypothetical protein
MDEYGYLLNNLASSVKRYTSQPATSFVDPKNTTGLYILIACILVFALLVWKG